MFTRHPDGIRGLQYKYMGFTCTHCAAWLHEVTRDGLVSVSVQETDVSLYLVQAYPWY